MTGSQRPCVAIARPYAASVPEICGDLADDARVRGTLDQRFRTIADGINSKRQAGQDTANAVGLYGPPGFKSPILRRVSVP